MDRAAIETAVWAALAPIVPANDKTKAPKDMLFSAKRTDAGRNLPPYYLVYFLLVDLLGFKDLGQFEKIAWSVPIDFDGKAFLVEHRKFGLGIFAADEDGAEEVAKRIRNAVEIAQPYFEWLADQAANGSNLNVVNKSAELFSRHRFFFDHYNAKKNEAQDRKDEVVRTEHAHGFSVSYPAFQLEKEATWFAVSTIESFFSWTEHVFILLAILQGHLTTGRDVKNAANENWHIKFERVFDLGDPATKAFYDELTIVRQQIRNFDAHGSFGKQREAFSFHSSVGAVPLRLPHQQDVGSMRFGHGVDFVDDDAIKLIERFIAYLWSDQRSPARIYVQESYLPLILTYAVDGTYAKAMTSEDEMELFCDHLSELHDRYANMDF